MIKIPPKEKIGLLSGVLAVCFPNHSCHVEKDPEKPNFILILADDLGWADVGYNGASFYETPNIDRLAAEGMIFDRFYPGAANCAPSRACLMTGMYTPRHDVYIPQGKSRGGDTRKMRWKVPTHGEDSSFNTFHVSINTVAPEFESIAEMLGRAGYISARLGKWHIGDDNQGFDLVSAEGTSGYITNMNGTEKRFYDDTTVARKLTDAALDFMENNKEKPFFLYLSHWEVHLPMAARQSRIGYYREKLFKQKGETGQENNCEQDHGYDHEKSHEQLAEPSEGKSNESSFDPVYAAEVEQIDISVGRVMNKLEALGLESSTMVIFSSDNGGVSRITSNKPLRAGKGTFYEGGIRTPMCIRWPQVVVPGSRTSVPVTGVDLMPTFAEIASVPVPGSQPVDGISILPLLKEDSFDSERKLFFHFPLYLGGGEKDQVLPAYDGTEHYWRAVPLSVIMHGKWKLIRYYEYDNFELFNLEEDISEEHDLTDTRPGIARQLVEELKSWTEETKAPIPEIPNPPDNSDMTDLR